MTSTLLHDLVAGGVAGSAGIFVGHPFDSIKVRMQAETASSVSSSSSSSSLRRIPVDAMGRSLWAGIGPPLAMASVVNASVFLTYGQATRMWDDASSSSSYSSREYSPLRNATCGGIAGIVSSFVVCPADHIKTRMQTHNPNGPSSPSSSYSSSSSRAARHIFVEHGVVGLYRGFAATIARQCPGFVVYFGVYDGVRARILSSNNAISTGSSTMKSTTSAIATTTMRPRRDEILASVAAGGISGSLSWAMVYPLDLIKTRIQSLPMDCERVERSMAHVASDVIRKHGYGAMYRGFGVTILRAFPVNGIIFPVYEWTLEALKGCG
jgi:hypothetical protein